MTWTYSGDPSLTPIDAVHYLIGDTNAASPLATDEECRYALRQEGQNAFLAAASLADTKARSFIHAPVSVKDGTTAINYGDQVKAWSMLAAELRTQASIRTSIGIYVGGQSVSEHQGDAHHNDLVQPFATTRLHDPARRHGRTDAWDWEG